MKTRLFLALITLTIFSCDRHEWEGPDGTSRLFKDHGSHDEGHGDHAEKGHEEEKGKDH